MEARRYLTYNLLRVFLFGVIYAIYEVNVPFYKYIPCLDYRILYFFIFLAATVSVNIRIWLANFFASMVVEDLSYWLIKDQLPFQYAWYYPVVDHIPLVDVVEGALALYLYSTSWRRVTQINPQISNCDMFYWFIHGKTHDLYGLLVLFVSAATLNVVSTNVGERVFSLIAIVVSVGVFVDLWSHCFHH